jgi:hypothetical protein
MESILGSSIAVFIGVTVVLFGGASWMTGRALAVSWKPLWMVLPYGALLGLGARFLTFALFEGEFLSPSGYLISTAVLVLGMFIAYRLYHVRQMVQQYPWMYERRWLFAWREKDQGEVGV